ncbi:Subtilisin-like protease [Acorus gramineus]|uniref:Subtilisin-like protease n=1 Tax=Acorus gramineus TaxID=55184 RepID=A0AAV9B4I8_ACOGR|nr:Subtilisin-like protease [Acorus gramineus]
MRFFETSSDIGSFHAAQVGVAVVFSAGNDGPEPSIIGNVAPWAVTVAASSVDRNFPTAVVLGNNVSITGEGFIVQNMNMKLADGTKYFDDGDCSFDKWHGKSATGTIILCFSTVTSGSSTLAALAILAANGSGLIFAEPMARLAVEVDFFPIVHVDITQGTQILYYIQSSKSPTVEIHSSVTDVGDSSAPIVAYFSSRGPSSVSPDILKPDVSAPGVNILAAWSPKSPPSLLPIDRRSTNWNFESGTSMSCPHVSGIVALLCSAHPDWSPAVIKSALMTTAYTRDTSLDHILAGGTLKPVDPFDIGAGHVCPLSAIDPGLVYDMDGRDYVLFLCSLGYTQPQIKAMVLPSPSIETRCVNRWTVSDLNYPAIVVSDLRSTVSVPRTLRNIGPTVSVYFLTSIMEPKGVQVTVWPRVLVYTHHRSRASFYVTMAPVKRSRGRYGFGEIVWSDGLHSVRSPVIVRVNNVGRHAGGNPRQLNSSSSI